MKQDALLSFYRKRVGLPPIIARIVRKVIKPKFVPPRAVPLLLKLKRDKQVTLRLPNTIQHHRRMIVLLVRLRKQGLIDYCINNKDRTVTVSAKFNSILIEMTNRRAKVYVIN